MSWSTRKIDWVELSRGIVACGASAAHVEARLLDLFVVECSPLVGESGHHSGVVYLELEGFSGRC